MFVAPEVLITIFLDGLMLIFLTIAFIIALAIVRFFDFGKDTPLQYRLERQSFLASTIVRFALAFKIGLLFYFIFALDSLSAIIPGAMCAAGVVTANLYGVPLLVLKIVGIYLFGLWLVANAIDLDTKDYHYTRFKFAFFLPIYLLVVVEFVLEILYFNGLDVSKVVSCCGVLFNPLKSNPVASMLLLPPKISAILFYGTFALLLLAASFRKIYLFGVASLLFLVIALIALIQFFSPYIYELPTHHCPFCLLQKEYHYIGYLLYATLFGGTFLGIAAGFKKLFFKCASSLRWAVVLDGIYVTIVSAYVLSYYYRNGVWLF